MGHSVHFWSLSHSAANLHQTGALLSQCLDVLRDAQQRWETRKPGLWAVLRCFLLKDRSSQTWLCLMRRSPWSCMQYNPPPPVNTGEQRAAAAAAAAGRKKNRGKDGDGNMMLNTYHCKYSVGAAFCTIFLNPENFPLCFLTQSLNSTFFTS